MFIILLSILNVVIFNINAMELPLPFPILVKNPTYIDKTSYLRDILDHNDSNMMIITSPPGFGKTVVISMIEHFASAEFNDDSSIKQSDRTDSSRVFQNTKIADDSEFLQQHQSQYIVLTLNLQINLIDPITPESIRDKLLDVVHQSVEKYSTVLENYTKQCPENPPSSDWNMESDVAFLNKFYSRNISTEQISSVLYEIISILGKCSGHKVILLIDSYDHLIDGFSPLNANLKLEEFYLELNTMILNAASLFVTSTFMHKILIMSSSTIPLKWVKGRQKNFSENFNIYRFLVTHRFLQLMGLTEPEVQRLISIFKLNDNEKRVLLTYYDAYRTYPNGEKIYSPRSLVNFIKIYRTSVTTDDVLSIEYRAASKRIEFIKEYLNNASKLEIELLSFISNQSVPIVIGYDSSIALPAKVTNLMSDPITNPLSASQFTWTYLYEYGYLTPVIGNSSCLHRIANQESQRILYKFLLTHHNESRLPFGEIGKCSQQFVHRDVILSKHSIAALFGLVERLLARCIENTAQYPLAKDNELKYQAILYVSSSQFAWNSTWFVVSTMQFKNRANDTYYGVYYYNKDEKICSIVIAKNSIESGDEKEALLNQAASSYALPHSDVKHLMYAVINVFSDGHLETFYTTYERY